MGDVRHLYVHLPFCAHRCGYCDFVTVVGRRDRHAAYVESLVRELALERHLLGDTLDTVFVGGGTPTFTAPDALARLLAALPPARDVTVEANPETVTPAIARTLRDAGVTRVSLGAQTFQPRLLEVLERTATPDDVRRAVDALRDALFDNISLDLVYGIPGQEPSDLEADLTEALSLRPEHLSAYELEAKPGTRFTHAWGDELARQAEAMEGYFEAVVERVTGAGYRWYETANFCLDGDPAGGRDLRAHHNLNTWRAGVYLGIGVGAVSTLPPPARRSDGGELAAARTPSGEAEVRRAAAPDASAWTAGAGEPVAVDAAGGFAGVAVVRRRNLPSVERYVAALEAGDRPPREIELIDGRTRAQERLMLGLRLDEQLALAGLEGAIDQGALVRMHEGGLVVGPGHEGRETIALTTRGRFLGDAVTAELLEG